MTTEIRCFPHPLLCWWPGDETPQAAAGIYHAIQEVCWLPDAEVSQTVW